MSFTIAGVPVILPTEELSDLIYENINPADVTMLTERSWPGFGNVGITYPTGLIPPRKAVVGRLVWPQKAARYAHLTVLMDSAGLNSLPASAFGGNGTYQPVAVNMTAGESLTTSLYMLPPLPVSGVGDSPIPGVSNGNLIPNINRPYIVTLVDERYWWRFLGFPTITPSDYITWGNIISFINSSLSTYFTSQITYDAIPAAYLNASPTAFYLPRESLGQIIDAVAYNVGMRFCRRYDGTCLFQNASNALSVIVNDFTNNPARQLRYGGDRFQSSTTFQ